MKILLTLVIGVLVGGTAVWLYATKEGRSTAKATGVQIESAAKSTKDVLQEQMKVLELRSDDIKEELARTGTVVRRKARDAGQAISDATADARTTAAIKSKLLASRDLSALSISVNTTGGIVTLSGTVNSSEDISKAMLLAMDTDGVREVVSTLQVKAKNGKK
jgi:hyperosmotically inducible periplasmic protein